MKRKIKKIATLLLCLSIATDGVMSTLVSNASASNQYLTNGNVLSGNNAGFESSTTVTNTYSKSWPEITDSWTTGWSDSNNVWSLEEADTHSGTKALKLTQTFSSGNNINTTLYSGYSLITDAKPTGRMQLEADTEYMISYWAKGTSQARIVSIKYTVQDDVSTETGTENKPGYTSLSETEWTLITQRATTNSLGEIKWYIQINATESGQYAIVDDVAVQKVADAVDSVEAMIDRFDVTGADAARTKDDIEQWCAAIGSEHISNYTDFENKITPNQYLTNGNVLSGYNAGFESSTTVTNTYSKSWPEITDSWTTGWSDSNNLWSLEEADTHSGTKALRLTQTFSSGSSTNTTLYSGYSLITDAKPTGRMQLEADTEYMISYWAKGTSQARIVSIKYTVQDDVSTETGTENKPGYTSLSETEWTLITQRATTNSLGEIKWYIQINATESGQYAIVDDVAVQKVDATADSVEMMIEALDTSKAGADRAIADIRQWCNVLDSRNIVNYGKFLSKTMENVDPLIEEWNVEEYRNLNGALPSPKTETENEYIFTGWFTNADVTTEENMKQYALKDKAGLNSESKVYARFVGATMLDVKAQLSVNKDSNSETRNIRFVTTIDNLAYQKIGFRITMNGHTKDTANNKVYTTLSATYSNGEQKIFRPDFFHKNSAYFKAATIPNIPERLFDATIEVTPYIVTLDGTTVEGLTVTKTVNQGIAATAAD